MAQPSSDPPVVRVGLQGYEHTAEDPALLYRVESMPGLGWVLVALQTKADNRRVRTRLGLSSDFHLRFDFSVKQSQN